MSLRDFSEVDKILFGLILILISFLVFWKIDFCFSRFFPMLSIQNFILFITFLGLAWYAWETRGMKEQMILQNEVEQEPLMTIFLRDSKSEEFKGKNFNIPVRYFLGNSPLIFRLRNIGRGAAFNVTVQSNNFFGVNFETHLFAPLKDEHCVRIIAKDNNDFFDINDLNGEEFFIFCKDLKGKEYVFKYKILDAESKIVIYLCKH